MLTAEQGAALHGQIANALQDANDGALEVVKTRLRSLQEMVDALVPDVDQAPDITISKAQAEYWAQRRLTDLQFETLRQAIPVSSVPDAVASIVDGFECDHDRTLEDLPKGPVESGTESKCPKCGEMVTYW